MTPMETLFSNIERYQRKTNAPLAVRMRPQTLDGFVLPFLFTDGGAHGWKIYDTDTVNK